MHKRAVSKLVAFLNCNVRFMSNVSLYLCQSTQEYSWIFNQHQFFQLKASLRDEFICGSFTFARRSITLKRSDISRYYFMIPDDFLARSSLYNSENAYYSLISGNYSEFRSKKCWYYQSADLGQRSASDADPAFASALARDLLVEPSSFLETF